MREERGGGLPELTSDITRQLHAGERGLSALSQAPPRESGRSFLAHPPLPFSPFSMLVGLSRPRSLETPVGLMTRRPQPARSTSESETALRCAASAGSSRRNSSSPWPAAGRFRRCSPRLSAIDKDRLHVPLTCQRATGGLQDGLLPLETRPPCYDRKATERAR